VAAALVGCKEKSGPFPAHVPLQDLRLDLCEVCDYQSVYDVAERGVRTEPYDSSAELRVLAQEYRNPLPIQFEIGHKGVGIGHDRKSRRANPGPFRIRPKSNRPARSDEVSERGLIPADRQHPDHQLARHVAVFGTDADGAEKHAIARVTHDESADALPEQHERAVVALVFLPHERPAQFKSRPQLVQEPAAVSEERS
jgi:hypothetical protein